jgi:hypothetical protein
VLGVNEYKPFKVAIIFYPLTLRGVHL